METIKIWVENLISMMGVKGDMIPITRHILLVLVAILLAAFAGLTGLISFSFIRFQNTKVVKQ